MKKQCISFAVMSLLSSMLFSQLVLEGEFRPRTEYRHGFGNLIPENSDPGYATSTRMRLNTSYTFDSYKFFVSLQDVMVWGENRQILPDDENNSFAIFEAWAQLNLGKGWSVKLGRQLINYDDQRIFGGVDWAQQGRNHDAGLLKYQKEKFMMDIGLAFSQDFDNSSGFQSIGTTYNTVGFFSYKTMQYLYLKQQWNCFSGSFLFLNNGFQNFSGETEAQMADGVSNLQTFGTHMEYKKKSFSAALNAFFQTGEQQDRINVNSAYLLGLDIGYKATDNISLGMGTELISGNKSADVNTTKAFFPLYGTNHKFNGIMDYFYVGNHANSIGLFDIHASANFKLGEKSNLLVKVLNFSGAQELPNNGKSLGTEIDLVFSQLFNDYGLDIGYSQLFASDGMYELKGITQDVSATNQNWAWVQLTIKPQFLNTVKAH